MARSDGNLIRMDELRVVSCLPDNLHAVGGHPMVPRVSQQFRLSRGLEQRVVMSGRVKPLVRTAIPLTYQLRDYPKEIEVG